MATCSGSYQGYLTLALRLHQNHKLHGEPFNFGPKHSQNKDVITLVKEMKKHWSNVLWKNKKNINELYESKLLYQTVVILTVSAKFKIGIHFNIFLALVESNFNNFDS